MPGAFDPGDGFWRRLHPIEFGVQIPVEERIADLDRQIIQEELPGVLNWAMDGYRDYKTRGLRPPQAVTKFAEEYRQETDIVGLWFKERCIEDHSAQITTADAYVSYCDFCDGEGIKTMTKPTFSRTLASRGRKKSRDTSVRSFVGFGLKSHVCSDFDDNGEDAGALI